MTTTPNTAALRDLLERVEAGTRGPGLNTVSAFGDTQTAMDAVDAFDGSLDAAKALHEAVLPGWWWAIGPNAAEVWADGAARIFAAKCKQCPARAWLIAVIKALLATDTEGR